MNPSGIDLGLTIQGVTEYVQNSMGSPAIQLHVQASQFKTEIKQVLDIYSRRKPRTKFATLAATPGQQKLIPDPTKVGYGIVAVMPPRFDPIAPLLLSAGPRLDIFGYRYSYPYRDISELEIDYGYFDMATRTLSSEIDWEYILDDDGNGAIYIYPAPVESFQLPYAYLCPKVLGDEDTLDLGGTGATATATINGQSLTITVTDGGTNYPSTGLTLSLIGGFGQGGFPTFTVVGGVITAIGFSGGCWRVAPQVIINSPGPIKCTIIQEDWDWIKDAVKARVKIIEGMILRRFGQIPGAVVPLQTDGSSLVEEGQKEWSAALEDLQLRTPEIPFRRTGNSSSLFPAQH